MLMHRLTVDGGDEQPAAMAAFLLTYALLRALGEEGGEIAGGVAAVGLVRGEEDLQVGIVAAHVADQFAVAQNDRGSHAAGEGARTGLAAFGAVSGCLRTLRPAQD